MDFRIAVLLALVSIVSVAEVALAAQHMVGGSQGWDESADYSSWASGQKFMVGDQLVFKYTSGLHSVVELPNESAYKNCDIGKSVDSMNTGKDVVKLNKPGTRYFACGTSGHCDQGMKVKITVTESGSSPSTPGSSGSSSSSAAASSAPPAIHSLVSSLVLTFALLTTISLLYVL